MIPSLRIVPLDKSSTLRQGASAHEAADGKVNDE